MQDALKQLGEYEEEAEEEEPDTIAPKKKEETKEINQKMKSSEPEQINSNS